MMFSHPLARKAKFWTARSSDGSESQILAIVTTLTLDPADKHFNKALVDRLSSAAAEFLAEQHKVCDFVLINRTKDWIG
ncbi:hypothetical protein M2322_004488 [Rhodoblastus acidophilus]|nr:hypothetical protein [Rhodoblastus acidophilus]